MPRQLSLAQVDAAQNVSLLSIVQDYEEQYEFKYGRKPQLMQTCSALVILLQLYSSIKGQSSAVLGHQQLA